MGKTLIIRGYFKNGKSRNIELNNKNDTTLDIQKESSEKIEKILNSFKGLFLYVDTKEKTHRIYYEKENLNIVDYLKDLNNYIKIYNER